jgi:hypothetical protein
MSDTYSLWCFVQGDKTIFPAIASSAMFIGELKNMIKKEKENILQGFDASDLTLCVISHD